MKLVVTGSLGHISKPLVQQLVKQGHKVTVISSNPQKQQDIEALGAKAAIGTVYDAGFLTSAFTGADAVYTMVPPGNFFNPNHDPYEHCRTVANTYAQAIRQSGVERVVHLSSIGAHLEKDSGLIAVHHETERILNNLSNTNITFMRPVAFYYNLLAYVPVIKAAGMIASNYGAEDRVPWVAPADIAVAIAEELATPGAERKIRYVASDEPTCNQIAAILGTAIGKPDLKWIVVPNEQMQNNLLAAGLSPKIAAALVEMNASMHNGVLLQDYFNNRPALGKIKMTDFAKEFAEAYNQQPLNQP